jgi:glycosyl transferase family 25
MGWLKEIAIHFAFMCYNLVAHRLPAHVRLSKDPFRAIGEYFDAVWVLTIQRNVERQDVFRQRFQGMRFEFIAGVDGKSLSENDPRLDLQEAQRTNRRPVRINELACTLSHLVMFKAIVDRGLERVLIFEDDAAFLKRNARWVPYCLERLPSDWELFYFGYREGELRGFQRELQECLGRHRDRAEVVSRSVGRGFRTAAMHDFTHAYAVTNAGARKLLQGAYPVSYTADGWLEHVIAKGIIRAYVSVPKLFTQDAVTGSTIHSG